MAGERHLEGVLAAAGGGAGVPALGLLLAMEAGQPVPIPSDLMMLLLGERVSADALPLWVAVLLLELVTWPAPPPCSWRPGARAGRR